MLLPTINTIMRQEALQNAYNIIRSLEALSELEEHKKLYVALDSNGRKYLRVSLGKNIHDKPQVIEDIQPTSLWDGFKQAILNISSVATSYIPSLENTKQICSRTAINLTSSITGYEATFQAVYLHLIDLKNTSQTVADNPQVFIPNFGYQLHQHRKEYKQLLTDIAKSWRAACKGLETLAKTYDYENDKVANDALKRIIDEVSKSIIQSSSKTLISHIEFKAKLIKVSEKPYELINMEDFYTETFSDIPKLDISNSEKSHEPVKPYKANQFRIESDINFSINASKVFDGFAIATKNPEKLDRGDFWKMIAHAKSKIIVGLNIGEKNEPWWAQDYESNHLKVKPLEIIPEYSFRKIKFEINDRPRVTLFILNYHSENDILSLMIYLLTHTKRYEIDWNQSPLVVYSDEEEHLSAIFLVMMRALRMAQNESAEIDINILHQAFCELRDELKGRPIDFSEKDYEEAYKLFRKILREIER